MRAAGRSSWFVSRSLLRRKKFQWQFLKVRFLTQAPPPRLSWADLVSGVPSPLPAAQQLQVGEPSSPTQRKAGAGPGPGGVGP